ncbi:nucleotidyltransferase domain-containing protein [Tistrella mobilis]|uniref:nucleotidyltransferase domain-containing protein n=1 Tax=Tistrella mobilis TaxID=171437 RepID=UPI0031F69373
MLRRIDPGMDSEVVARIDRRLDDLEAAEDMTILLAVESGSRAWGFPSPDSDYDCRFVYLRHTDRYLSPWPPRDVIETPVEGVFDVNGWDLAKALKLMLKGNAVILEWLRSPIVYRGDQAFRQGLLDFAMRHADRELIARHYLHLGERQRMTYFGDGQSVPQKKIFYALRPAAALRWLRLHPDAGIPPMHFPTLMAECEPPAAVAAIAEALMARKARTRELGTEPLDPVLATFIDDTFAEARAIFMTGRVHLGEAARAEAETFFRDTIRRRDARR